MKLRNGRVLAGAMVLAGVSTIAAQGTETIFDPVNQFCRRFYHQTARIGDRLYVDGGYVTSSQGGHSNNLTNTLLTYHDLSDDSTNTALLKTDVSKPREIPSVAGGALWADQANEKLYLFGGEFTDGPAKENTTAIYEYDPWVDKWSEMPDNAGKITSRPSFGSHTVIENSGKGYYYGGWLGENNVPGWTGPRQALNSMIIYDMQQNSILNVTGPAGQDPRVEGVLMYVPVGDTGLLVSFGGMYAEDGREDKVRPAPMSEVDIFDVTLSTWHRVNATGDIPMSRRRFCGGIVSAEDGSSHNVYVYGGAEVAGTSPGSDDVFILSMPSFRWIKYWEAEVINYHNGFTCDVLNDSQMIIIGGTFPYSDECDTAQGAQGGHYLDLGRANPELAEWYGYRKELKGYGVPEDITKVIGGGPGGRATLKTPEGGFKSKTLGTLFSRTLQLNSREPTRTPAEDDNDPADADKPKDSASLGIIIGPSVGVGVPALAAMFGFFLFRRRRNQQAAQRAQQERDLQLKLKFPDGSYQLPALLSPAHKSPDQQQLARYQYPVQPIYRMGDGKYHSESVGHQNYPQSPYGNDYVSPIEPSELPAGFDFQISELSATRASTPAAPPPPPDSAVHRRMGSLSRSAKSTQESVQEVEPVQPWSPADGRATGRSGSGAMF